MKIVIKLLYIAIVSMLVSLPAFAVEEKRDPLIEIQKEIASLKTTNTQLKEELSALKENLPDKNYVDLLEKTNQQLYLGWTPYSVTFTILAGLIGLMAIVAVAVVVLQGREHKNALEKVRRAAVAKFNVFLEERRAIFEKLEENINQLIAQYEKKMESATEEQKKEIEKVIKDLKEEKEKLQVSGTTYITEPIMPSKDATLLGASIYNYESTHVTCPNCDTRIPKKPRLAGTLITGAYTCPNCAHSFTA